MEAKAMEAKAMEDKAVEVKAMEAKAMEAKAMGAKAMEEKVMEWKAKAMGAAALMATMVTAMAAAATTCFSSGPHDGRGCTTGCNRLLVGCVSGCTPRRRAGVRVQWRSSSVRCGRQSTSRSRRANLGGRARWSRREEDRFHCATFEPFFLFRLSLERSFFWAFLLLGFLVNSETRHTEGANNQISEKLGS